MRKPLFREMLHVRVEPELRDTIVDLARREKTTAAEWTRRALRDLIRAAAAAESSQEREAA